MVKIVLDEPIPPEELILIINELRVKLSHREVFSKDDCCFFNLDTGKITIRFKEEGDARSPKDVLSLCDLGDKSPSEISCYSISSNFATVQDLINYLNKHEVAPEFISQITNVAINVVEDVVIYDYETFISASALAASDVMAAAVDWAARVRGFPPSSMRSFAVPPPVPMKKSGATVFERRGYSAESAAAGAPVAADSSGLLPVAPSPSPLDNGELGPWTKAEMERVVNKASIVFK